MNLTISPSSIETLQNCPQQYNYSTMRRLRLIDENRDALNRGTLFHRLLANYYQLRIDGIEPAAIVPSVIEGARALARDDEFPIEMVEEAIPAFSDYVTFYQNDSWIPKAVEQPFSKLLFENDEHKILLEGKIDLIVELPDGMRFPVDHKTESKRDITESLNNQFMAYCWATESNNIVRNGIGFQKTYGPDKRLHREVISYENTILEEWRGNVIVDCLNLISYMGLKTYPRRYSACKFCRYSKVCSTTEDNREYKIESLYSVGEGYDIFGEKR